jgi:hypothetical protein
MGHVTLRDWLFFVPFLGLVVGAITFAGYRFIEMIEQSEREKDQR